MGQDSSDKEWRIGLAGEGGLLMAAVALAGAGWALMWPQLPPGGLCGGLLAGALAGVGLIRRWSWRLAALFVFFAAWTWLQAGGVLARNWPDALAGHVLLLEGRVEEVPRHQGAASRFVMRLTQVDGYPDLAGRRVELHWRDRAGEPGDPARLEVSAGEHWRLRASLRPPRSLENPGGFDSARHALANRMHAAGWVEPGSAQRLQPGAGLHHWRGLMSARIGAVVPPAQAGFIQALAVGDTAGLTQEDWQVLRSSGLTHLVAISGFHVTLLGMASAVLAGVGWRFFPVLAQVLPRSQAQAVAALLGAGLYACAAGLGLPAVRTVLMVAVVCLARASRRTTSVWQSLCWALLAVLVADPLSLLAAGFWLSYAGVAWLAWSLGTAPLSQLKGLFAAQMVATVGLLPLTVFLFGQASLVGPLVNLLAIPWWSLLVVPLCVLALLLESLWQGLGVWAWQLAAWTFAPSWSLFSWMTDHPLAEWWLPESGLLATALAMLGAAIWFLPRSMPGRGLAVLLWLPLLWPQRELPGVGSVELHMLDVGQGQAIVVRTRHHVLLYDAGPAVPDGFDAGERVVVPALRALGVRRVDAMVLSHGDLDHAGGARAVVAGFEVGQVHGPPGMEAGVPTTDRCQRSMRWNWDGVDFEYLHPALFFPYLGNESSCVLRITAHDRRILLAGDIGQIIERELLQFDAAGLKADVVQVAHHGSAGSSQGAFIRATQARLALVSAGQGNRFGHPHPGVVARWQWEGAEVLQTAASGAIRVWIDQDGLGVRERRRWRKRLWHAGQ